MAGPRVLDERVLLWRVLLVLLGVAAYVALALVVGVSGVVSFPIGLATAGVLLLGGVIAFFAHGHALRQMTGLWPGFVFVVGFSAFHFASLGDIDAGWYAPELAPFAWLLSVVCLLGWMLGYIFGRGRAQAVPAGGAEARLGRNPISPVALRRLGRLGALILALGFASEVAIYARAGLGANWNYLTFKTVMNTQVGLGALHLLAQMACVVGVIVSVTCSALADQRVFSSRWVLALVALYMLNVAFQGDRSELAVLLFPILFVRHYLIRPFRNHQILALGIAAVLTVAGLKAFRSANELQTVATKIQDPDWVVTKTANETGHSLDTVVRALELVPGRFDYFAGQTYLDALSRVVPNILLRRQGAIVSSVWVTEQTTERRSAGKGGLGFSIVAEAYINFGAMGAPLLLFLLGLIHGASERVLTRPRLRVELFALFIIAELGLLVHVRNSAVLYIRGTIWKAVILFAVLIVFVVMERMRQRP